MLKPLDRQVADADSAIAAAEAEHAQALHDQQQLEADGGSSDPLAWARADGAVRLALHHLDEARQHAAKVRRCARLAATLGEQPDGARFVYSIRNDMAFAYPGEVTRPNGTVLSDAWYTRVNGTDFDTCRPDETSLMLLTDEDRAAILAGTWEAPRGEEWHRRIAAQYVAGRRARYEAKLAAIEANKTTWETQGVAWSMPAPPRPIPAYDPSRTAA